MANKYQSDIRTFTARNLLWNYSGSAILPYVMAPPAPIAVIGSDFVLQPYYANWGSGPTWNLKSNFKVHRIGLFSNFADGMLLSNYITRLSLTLQGINCNVEETVAPTVEIVQGSNIVTGTNWDATGIIFGPGYCCLIIDSSTISTGYVYSLYDVTDDGMGNFTGRLSDFAYRNRSLTSFYELVRLQQNNLFRLTIPTLNTMYDSEGFFANSVEVENIGGGTNETVILTAELGFSGGAADFTFYTDTIDPTLLYPVTFDSTIEVELTP